MPRFMVSCTMRNNQAPSAQLILESQQHFLELMKEGYLLNNHVDTAWVKCWLLMQAPDSDFIQNLLKTSPLADLMDCVVDELNE